MKNTFYFLSILLSHVVTSQNTVGTITNTSESYNGYTLFTPNASTETYLINNCGEIINQWTSSYNPGNSCYLLENGNLLRTGKIANSDISFGGVGGHIQLFDWDNNLLWEYSYSSSEFSQHHDIYPLPNGNILMLAVDTMTEAFAISAGRDPSLILDGKIFNEQILELEPVGTNDVNIVWQWDIKDHLIQDFDSSKSNFGIVKDHPELLDFNFLNDNNGNANWLHFNSIQYNSSLNQIVISSRRLDEIYIIDHSTSMAEASTHSGGTYGKGGDFLYRWGNPQAYNTGDANNRTLFSQHYPHWIPDGLADAGKLLIFNNGNAVRYSSIDIIDPPTTAPGVYSFDATTGFGPESAEWTYTDDTPSNFFSSILSSAQRLPNGNTLICDGDSGYFFEIDPSKNIVWEYRNPDTANGVLSQGDTPSANLVFRAFKYSPNYPAFTGRDLTPGDPIELNPDLSGCSTFSISENNFTNISVSPNPSSSAFYINDDVKASRIQLYNLLGTLIKTTHHSNKINVENLPKGIYILNISVGDKSIIKRVIKN